MEWMYLFFLVVAVAQLGRGVSALRDIENRLRQQAQLQFSISEHVEEMRRRIGKL